MNLRAVGWLLGCMLLLLAAFLLVPVAVSAYYLHAEGLLGEAAAIRALLISAALTAVCGGLLALPNRGSTLSREGRSDYFRREGLAVVGLVWLVAPIFGALPFLLSGAIHSPTDAFFESVSGFTTTGSSILQAAELDGLSRGISFWRLFSHALGGTGIVVVFVVLFPTGGRSLFRSEVPGIDREANRQRVRDSAFALVRIFYTLTAVQTALLMLAGLDWFDALTHAFATLATGGFSPRGASVASFDSWLVEAIIVVFMLAGGLNFAYYDACLRLGPRKALRLALDSGEVRAYLGLAACSIALISVALWFWGGSNGAASDLPDYRSFLLCLRDASFNVVNLGATCGFTQADFDRWPDFCRALLMVLVMVGPCAGSTGGGLKMIRSLIVFKAAVRGVRRFARPRAIYPLRVDGQTLDESVVASVTGFFALWMIVSVGSSLAIAALGVDLVTAATSVIATLNNAGPGLGVVGPAQNFAALPDAAKLLLSFLMLFGRLEFYALVVLVIPSFWRK